MLCWLCIVQSLCAYTPGIRAGATLLGLPPLVPVGGFAPQPHFFITIEVFRQTEADKIILSAVLVIIVLLSIGNRVRSPHYSSLPLFFRADTPIHTAPNSCDIGAYRYFAQTPHSQDLFHQSRPPKYTLWQAMCLFHCTLLLQEIRQAPLFFRREQERFSAKYQHIPQHYRIKLSSIAFAAGQLRHRR